MPQPHSGHYLAPVAFSSGVRRSKGVSQRVSQQIWVLMDNHYHAVIETPQGNLVVGMRWFQNTSTRRFNTRHRMWGYLFGGRYKAVLVEGGEFGNGEGSAEST
jgi:REP element-mobilizing transposase RayT